VRPTTPAAEIQQNLLPPRLVRISGASVAGNVLPGYDIGGDWFDYAENPDGTWIGIADAEGTGPRAAGWPRSPSARSGPRATAATTRRER
jgi:serine phosphatase RsbU (regulator of sigma subunit)